MNDNEYRTSIRNTYSLVKIKLLFKKKIIIYPSVTSNDKTFRRKKKLDNKTYLKILVTRCNT